MGLDHHDETLTGAPPAAGFSANNLRGVMLPFPTPFTAEGDVDPRIVRANIERWNATGVVAGYVALGSTGERVHLNERERAEVIDAARRAVPEKSAFIVGIGHESTRATIDEATAAARAGAGAVLTLTPHFYRTALTPQALIDYFSAVADASPVPVIIYHIPQNTGMTLAPETVARLSGHPNIIGIKDSSGDIISLAEVARLVPDRFAVMTGNAAVLYAAVCAGARGAILAAACLVPQLCVEIIDAVKAGEHDRALGLQRRLTPLARAVATRLGIGGLKAALDMCGYTGGAVRAPLQNPDEAGRRDLRQLLAEFVPGGEAEPSPAEEEGRRPGAAVRGVNT